MQRGKKDIKINITFHNPNTADETAKYLAKILAHSIAENALKAKPVEERRQVAI